MPKTKRATKDALRSAVNALMENGVALERIAKSAHDFFGDTKS